MTVPSTQPLTGSRPNVWARLPVLARGRILLAGATALGLTLRDVHLVFGVLGLWSIVELGGMKAPAGNAAA